MIREEEIKQAACSRYAIVSSPVVFKAQCNCFIEGARWADEHPHKPTREEIFKELRSNAEHTERLYTLMGQLPPIEQLAVLQMEEGRKQAIDKACEWLKKNANNYQNLEYNEFHQCVEYDGSYDIEKMISDFRKTMEE